MNPSVMDVSLDRIIKATQRRGKSEKRETSTRTVSRGRAPTGRGRGRAAAAEGDEGTRTRAPRATGRGRGAGAAKSGTTRTRKPREFPGHEHLAGSSLDDIAAADDGARTLKVSKETNPKKLAGSIKYILGVAGAPPTALAGGPSAVNQAVKAIAIARADVASEGSDILVQPTFDGGSVRCALEMYSVKKPLQGEMDTEDFLVKGSSDPFKVAGAIAGRIREGQRIGILAKGEDAVFKTVESISVARRYVEEENVDIKFAPKFVDLEDDAGVTSTYVHFAVVTRKSK